MNTYLSATIAIFFESLAYGQRQKLQLTSQTEVHFTISFGVLFTTVAIN